MLIYFRHCYVLLMINFDKYTYLLLLFINSIILDHIFCILFFCSITNFTIISLLIILRQKIYFCLKVLHSPINMYKFFFLVRKKCCVGGSAFAIIASPTVGTLRSGQLRLTKFWRGFPPQHV